MFRLFYKHSYSFYLPSQLIEDIFNSYNELTSKFITLFFSSQLNNLQKKQIDINRITDFLFHINIKFKTEEELNSFKKFIDKFKELLPPWKVFPNLFQGSPRWNQGFEEDYCVKYWIPFWKNLSEKQKNDYRIKYKCPDDWKNWLDENNNVL